MNPTCFEHIDVIDAVPTPTPKRPTSYSESFAKTPANFNRVASNLEPMLASIRSVGNLQSPQTTLPLPKPRKRKRDLVLEMYLRFSFHLTLIALFESTFFIFYLSNFLSSGLISRIDYYINVVSQSCVHFTEVEIQIVDSILNYVGLNVSAIIATGNAAEENRISQNVQVQLHSWFFAVTLFVMFIGGVAFVVLLRKVLKDNILIPWKEILLENIALVMLLALLEYTYFNLVVFQFTTISTAEIDLTIINTLQTECGLLLPPQNMTNLLGRYV